MRLFLAINIPHDVRLEIVAATSALRGIAPELGWVAEDRLHLTLRFLGEVDEARVSEIAAAVSGVAGRHRELAMEIGGIGAFPNFRRARVVWMGVTHEARLELLHHDVELACESLGFEVEGRAFRPHLTLARVKTPLTEDRLRALSRAGKKIGLRTNVIVRSVDLMSSELSRSGPTYRTVASAALRRN